jgi:hypothetical protein
VVTSAFVWGCGAGAPLLHPAHPLPSGQISASSGVSAHFAPPDAQRSIDSASAIPTDERSEDPQTLVDGALAQTLSTPGLAPWFAIRVGMDGATEAGLAYTGRRVRGDLRYAFVFDQYALSAGGGLTGIMPDIGSDPPTDSCNPDYCEPIVNDSYSEIPGLDTGSISGYGFDVPLLAGWRSHPGLLAVWAGLRGRYEHMTGDFRYAAAGGARTAPASGSRTVFQGVFGISLGIKPIWALFELSPAYERISGTVNLDSGEVGSRLEGFSFSPAIALMYAP